MLHAEFDTKGALKMLEKGLAPGKKIVYWIETSKTFEEFCRGDANVPADETAMQIHNQLMRLVNEKRILTFRKRVDALADWKTHIVRIAVGCTPKTFSTISRFGFPHTIPHKEKLVAFATSIYGIQHVEQLQRWAAERQGIRRAMANVR